MFRNTLGREPTQDEYNQALPFFHGQGDQGRYTGMAYLNQLRQQELQDPTKGEGRYAPEELEQYTGDINDSFREMLGRDPSGAELEHFQKLIASGQADPFTLRYALQGMPEYQEKQDREFRGGLAEELAGYDQPVFDRQKQDILSHYAQQGMPAGTSPSLDFALTDMMGKIAQERGKYLAGLSAQQYGGNKALAVGDYQRQMDQIFGNQNFQRGRQAQQQDYLTGRLGERQDYQQQMSDYLRMAGGGRQQGPSRGAQSFGGALQGAAAFAPLAAAFPPAAPYILGGGAFAGGLYPWLS
jgi:hypothetical protein